MGGEAEHIVVVLLLVSQAIVANAWHGVPASAGFSGVGNWILNRAVAQPTSIAPVQFSLPGLMELFSRCYNGILVSTCLLRSVEIEVVSTKAGEVGEDNTYKSDIISS